MLRHHRADDDFNLGLEEDDGGDGADNLDFSAFDVVIILRYFTIL
jgi:hypothetical protein